MASYSEKILNDSMKREKPLGLASRFESAHLPFPMAGRLMRGFGALITASLNQDVDHVALLIYGTP